MQGKIGVFEIIKTIGTGASCKVKLGIDTRNGKKVAIKVIKNDMEQKLKDLLQVEVKAMACLNHDNIVNQVEYGTAQYMKTSGKSREVDYIVLELANGGELFDFISASGRFEEPLARYFFKQFMTGLDYCHQQNVAHRDLKPENVLLDAQYTLKIADFGFAAPAMGRDQKGQLHTKLGTLNYMAPEICLKQPYQGKSVDLFASAIILFIMVAQHPPFNTAEAKDPFYKVLAANRADIFWKTHSQNKPQLQNGDPFFSDNFKDLITGMLQLDAAHRPSMSEVMNHPWMQGPVPTAEQVFAEFEYRQQAVDQEIENNRQQKLMEKANYIQAQNNKTNRSGPIDPLAPPTKELFPYESVFKCSTQFFSTYHPDLIEEALQQHLQESSNEPKMNQKKYKMSFNLTEGQGEDEKQNKIQVKISQASEDKYCVEFMNLEGDSMQFLKHFENFKNKTLAKMNDSLMA